MGHQKPIESKSNFPVYVKRKRAWFFAALLIFIWLSAALGAQTLIWSGNIPGNGNRIGPINLTNGGRYYVEVQGYIYFGKWRQNGRDLLNDSCFEFNARSQPVPMTILQNNLGIIYCSSYNPAHIYRSAPFLSKGQPLFFQVYDTDYRDNRGNIAVRVFLVQGGSTGSGQSRSIKLFNAVPRQNSSKFKANRFPEVRVNTNQWDRTPYHINKSTRFNLRVPPGGRVYLSSKSDQWTNIYIDNFLLFIVSSGQGQTVFSVGHVDPLTYKGSPVTRTLPISLNPKPEITKYIPQGLQVTVTVYALDYGAVGGMSEVYLLVR
ncbi:MAG: hypothetical protein KAW12_27965 [Candidatus Aminicenantes bacterium]|nr:hypothetical protein [Candidatus Aminicenantes bacterium]